jgi:hypothetical protein
MLVVLLDDEFEALPLAEWLVSTIVELPADEVLVVSPLVEVVVVMTNSPPSLSESEAGGTVAVPPYGPPSGTSLALSQLARRRRRQKGRKASNRITSCQVACASGSPHPRPNEAEADYRQAETFRNSLECRVMNLCAPTTRWRRAAYEAARVAPHGAQCRSRRSCGRSAATRSTLAK